MFDWSYNWQEFEIEIEIKKKKRDANFKVLMELVTLELGDFRGGFKDDFDLISKSSLLATSCQYLVVWQER